jgi:hypothetical protein
VLVEPRSSRLRLALIAFARWPVVAGRGKPCGCLLFPPRLGRRRHRLVAAGVLDLAAVAAAAPHRGGRGALLVRPDQRARGQPELLAAVRKFLQRPRAQALLRTLPARL